MPVRLAVVTAHLGCMMAKRLHAWSRLKYMSKLADVDLASAIALSPFGQHKPSDFHLGS